MILGDSLQVMASLAEREGLRGKVQCIYFDPPYGIKFGSNWQVSTRSRTVQDGKSDQICREAEMVKAFRDTWSDGIHSYLTYLRDRLAIARDLLHESGSIFFQIGDENVHRAKLLLDEVFGEENYMLTIPFTKKGNQKSNYMEPINDYIIWYARSPKHSNKLKFRKLYKDRGRQSDEEWAGDITNGGFRKNQSLPFEFEGKIYNPKSGRCWSTTVRTEDGSTPMTRYQSKPTIKQKTLLLLKRKEQIGHILRYQIGGWIWWRNKPTICC